MAVTKFFMWLMFWGVLYASGCIRSEKDDHPEHYGKYIKQLAEIFDQPKRALILDSFQKDLRRYSVGDGDRITFYTAKASFYITERDFDKALPWLDSIIIVTSNRMKEERFVKSHVEGITLKSECYLRMKNYDELMKYLLEAKLVLNKYKKDGCSLLGYNQWMASMFYVQARYRFAITHFMLAIEDEKQCDTDSIKQFAYVQANFDNIGMAYRELGMNDSAMFFFNKALAYINDNEPRFPQKTEYITVAKAVIYGNMAKVKRKEQQYAEAEKLNRLSIQGLRQTYANLAIDASFELANTYIEWNKLNEATYILKELDSLDNLHVRSDILENALLWNRSMKELWLKKRDTSRAFLYNARYTSLKDSIDMLAKNSVKRDMGYELKNKEQTAQRQLLSDDNQKKSFQLLAVLILAITVLVTGLFIWNNFRRTARHEKSLQILNHELQLKNEDVRLALLSLQQIQSENEKITRMVAHDLKNPLGGIRNLLYSFIKKPSLAEVRNKMEEMSSDCNVSLIIINELLKDGKPRVKEGIV